MTPIVPTDDPTTWPKVGTHRRDLIATPLCEKPAPGLIGIICTRQDDHTGPCVALTMDFLVRAVGTHWGHVSRSGTILDESEMPEWGRFYVSSACGCTSRCVGAHPVRDGFTGRPISFGVTAEDAQAKAQKMNDQLASA